MSDSANGWSKRLRRVRVPAVLALLALSFASGAIPNTEPGTSLHYAPNHNFDQRGVYLLGQDGFNVADVSRLKEVHALPSGVKGLVWVGQCDGVTARFLETVRPYVGSPGVFGFYLMDNPDPRSRIAGHLSAPCTAEQLNAEADWIHANAPGARTFIVLMNLSSSATPSFDSSYDPRKLHIDLFGIDPYPCRSELKGCDYAMIDRYVVAAQAIGVARSRMIPVYQAFGGGGWADDDGGRYLLPSAEQERHILSRWGKLVPAPVFDYAYSWGSQKHDGALENTADLRAVFAVHNGARQSDE